MLKVRPVTLGVLPMLLLVMLLRGFRGNEAWEHPFGAALIPMNGRSHVGVATIPRLVGELGSRGRHLQEDEAYERT
jgi:hypothetical protein